MHFRNALIGAAVFGLVAGNDAWAAPLLDANYSASSVNTVVDAARLSLAQTFTVVNAGTLASAAVFVDYFGTPNADLQLQIRTLNSGLPSEFSAGSTVLASATLPYTGLATSLAWTTFNFTGFQVTAGEQLALVLTSATTGGEYVWNGDLAWPQFSEPAGTYAGGQGYVEGTSTSPQHLTWGSLNLCNVTCNNPALVDFSFRTYVDSPLSAVPEPSTWAMMILGFCGLGFMAYRRRNHLSLAV